jgi:hypothetical protein
MVPANSCEEVRTMGLDVGVVKLAYLDRPGEPVYSFLWSLVHRANEGGWGGSWDGNAFLEIEHERLVRRARRYAERESLSSEGLDELLTWIAVLPWERDVIMFHFNW